MLVLNDTLIFFFSYHVSSPIVFLSRTVIFINGCFWHGHNGCKYFVWPKNNGDFWKKKIESNVLRDKNNHELLAAMGWRIVTIWECELKKPVFLKTVTELAETIKSYGKKR